MKMKKLLWTSIADKQAKGGNLNSALIRQKAKRIVDLEAGNENCQVEMSTSKGCRLDKFKLRAEMTSLQQIIIVT